MKKLNRKGFTLIELLAVIVILGVLLAVAIPAVAKYINSAKKGTYVDNCIIFVDAAKNEANTNSSKYTLPINNGEAIAIKFSALESSLDQGGTTSSYGGEFKNDNSFVVIVNTGTAEEPTMSYYVAALDDKGYGIGIVGTDNTTSPVIQNSKYLKDENVVQLHNGVGASIPSVNSNITLSENVKGDSTSVAKIVKIYE